MEPREHQPRPEGAGPAEAGRAPSERTRVRRVPRRALYDRGAIEEILDASLVSHLGTVRDGAPVVLPTLHARIGGELLVHGSSASASLRGMRAGLPACLTATLVDGLVLARSALHHSVNYRSVVIHGTARAVDDEDEKLAALEALTDRIAPGRWSEVRWPTRQELKATAVLVMSLDEASAKVRRGPPLDDEDDYALDCWAGVIPLRCETGPPVPDERLRPGIETSPAARRAAERWRGT